MNERASREEVKSSPVTFHWPINRLPFAREEHSRERRRKVFLHVSDGTSSYLALIRCVSRPDGRPCARLCVYRQRRAKGFASGGSKAFSFLLASTESKLENDSAIPCLDGGEPVAMPKENDSAPVSVTGNRVAHERARSVDACMLLFTVTTTASHKQPRAPATYCHVHPVFTLWGIDPSRSTEQISYARNLPTIVLTFFSTIIVGGLGG